ncbi:MAG: aspartate kinase [Candidatus Aminicenantaceae bacterium]
MKVMKFGGGCLKDYKDILQVAELIKSEIENTAVVLSAISGITDILLEGIDKAIHSETHIDNILKTLIENHHHITEKAIHNKKIKERTLKCIDTRMKKLGRLLHGIAYTEEITPSIKASVLSYGERFSVHLIAGVLNSINKNAEALESDHMGIITDDSYENATANLNEVKKNLSQTLIPILKRGTIAVTTGYFGCTSSRKVTLFGRNGSDYSAAVIAYGITASSLEIWKEVDGFMSADPAIVKEASRIERLSYYEAAELSYFGARILHPRTVEPLSEKSIPLFIKNTHKAESKGTIVLNKGNKKEKAIKSVTYNKNISILKIRGPGVGYKPGIIAQIGSLLSKTGINIISILTSQTCINLLIDKNDSSKSDKALQKLAGGVIEKINVHNDMALVAVVGEGLQKEKGVAAKVFSAVAKEKINVEMISSGASDVASYFIVLKSKAENAVNAIHKEFFNNNG